MTLYNVCSVKTVPGIKTWVAVDGGMGDNIRPALYTTGAYTFSMASNYNRVRRPAVVLVKGDRHRLSVRRQTFKDLIEGDM